MTNRSIATVVALLLTSIAILFLSTVGIVGYNLYSSQRWAELRALNQLLVEQSAMGLTLPVWTFDHDQILRLAESIMHQESVFAVVVQQIGDEKNTVRLVRNSEWNVGRSDSEVSAEGLIVGNQPIRVSGQQLGSVQIFSTPKFLEKQLASVAIAIAAAIAVLALVLVLALYLLLWRMVINPLQVLERYALDVSRGTPSSADQAPVPFIGELGMLRSSLTAMVLLLAKRYDDLERETRRAQESEILFRTLLKTIPDLVWLTDPAGVYLSGNHTLEKLLGASEGQFIGKTAASFIDPEMAIKIQLDDAQVMNSGMPSTNEEWMTFTGNQQKALLETVRVPFLGGDGRLIGVLGIGRDITERKQREDELRVLSQAVEQTTVAIVMTDLAGHVEFVNPAFLVLTGYDQAEVIGQNLRFQKSALTTGEQIREFWTTILRGETWRGEFWNVKKNAETYCERVTVAPILDENKNLAHFVAIKEDITERKKSEIELDRYRGQLEAMVENRTADLELAREAAESASLAKTSFLANMSHELRTPLNAILGFSQIVSRNPSITPQDKEHLAIILKSGEFLLSILNDILDLSKIESGKSEVMSLNCDLGELIDELVTMLRVRAESKGLDLIFDQSSSFPRFVRTDPGKLRQVIINLVGNAIKFTQSGEVSIKLGVLSQKAAHDKPQLVFTISDTGAGIPATDLERIFQPFVQLGQHEGTGLGLSITREFVRLLGGNLTVESEEGRGSAFRFTIAVEDVTGEEIKSVKPAWGPILSVENASSCRILIVEDHLDNQLLLTKLLEPWGFQLRQALNGQEGLELFQTWQPQLILMDRRMSVLDGMAATRAIRAAVQVPQPVIIAVTAHAFSEEQAEMLEAGCDDFMAKPFSPDRLFQLLEKYLPIKMVRGEPASASASTNRRPNLSGLRDLPPTIREELADALKRLDMNQIHRIIARVGKIDPVLETALDQLASRFEYGTITEALLS